MEPFLATRKEKKFGLEDGSVVFVRVLFPVLLQSRKIPPKELLLFSVQSPVKNALSLKETRSMLLSIAYLLCFLYLLTKTEAGIVGKKKTTMLRESCLCTKRMVLMVFSLLPFLRLLCFGLTMFGGISIGVFLLLLYF